MANQGPLADSGEARECLSCKRIFIRLGDPAGPRWYLCNLCLDEIDEVFGFDREPEQP